MSMILDSTSKAPAANAVKDATDASFVADVIEGSRQATADMYCKAIGYASATAFSKGWSNRATIMLGSKEICKPVFGSVAGQKCEALQNVTCTRQVFKKQPGLTPEMPGSGG
jgi:hypothetical protein